MNNITNTNKYLPYINYYEYQQNNITYQTTMTVLVISVLILCCFIICCISLIENDLCCCVVNKKTKMCQYSIHHRFFCRKRCYGCCKKCLKKMKCYSKKVIPG